MSENRIQKYFIRPVRIVGMELPAWGWMVGSFAAICFLAVCVYALLYANVLRWLNSSILLWGSGVFLGIVFLGLFLVLLRAVFSSIRQFTIFTLVLAAASFATNAYVLSHEVFPPFTSRTEVALWVCFIALAISALNEWLSDPIRYALLPLLSAGAFLCVAFVIVLGPLMAFAWFFVWAAGLGFLPYSPLFALVAFVLNLMRLESSVRQRVVARWLIAGPAALIVIYSIYYKIQWNRAEEVMRRPEISAGHNRLDEDLPLWIQKAARIPANHVTQMVLQPNRRSEISIFGLQTLFDPLAFLSSTSPWSGSRGVDIISAEDSGRMLHLLYGQSHAYLDRLWRGHSLITTNVQTHVQIHPELRVAYTETTLSIFNEDQDSNHKVMGLRLSAGNVPQEAIYTISVPEGSICTKLSLWVNGEERPARLTFKSTARRAYETIVSVERRDPSYVEWLDGNRLRLRVFPVSPGQYRTVRVGIVSPLRADEGRLTYNRIEFDGPVQTFAEQSVLVDLFSSARLDVESSGMFLKEKVVSDGQVRQFRGSFVRPHWSFSFPAPAAGGSISAGGKSFLVHPLQMENKPFSPQAILVAVNGSRSRAAWKEFISKTYGLGLPVYILTNEWFETADVKKAMAYLDDCEIPAFNLYPPAFPATRKLGPVLWVTSGEEQSIPLGELRGSIRFANTQIAATERPADAVAVLNGRVSEYTASLIDLDRLLLVAQDEASTLKMLGDRRIQVPRETERVFPLRASAIELEESAESASRPGSDLLVRMLMYRRIMRTLGQRFFNHDLDNADMVKLARDGMIVSPVSTLIVLESEADYKRFGIENDPSLLGQSKLEAPGAVPEPHELALLLLILLVIFYTRTRIRTAVHAHSR